MPNQSEDARSVHVLGSPGLPIHRDDTLLDVNGRTSNYPIDTDYVACESCREVNLWENMQNWQCNECYDYCDRCESSPCECDNSMPERLYSAQNLPEFQSNDAGKIITSPRVFSAEIECYTDSVADANTISRAINRNIGITGDGSLNEYGIELQTPKLKGKNGENALKAVCKVLNDHGATVDTDCGLHIHLDGKGLLPRTLTTTDPIALKQLWQFYVVFDNVLLSFLPKSRRGNTFCKSMRDTAKHHHISNCRSQRDIEVLWYKTTNIQTLNQNKSHQKHSSRYHGVNMHILLAEKHLEVRFHSGTINATKMLEWTALHQRIADMAAANTLVTVETILDMTLADQTKMFFSILGLPERAQKYFMRRQAQFAPKMVTLPANTWRSAREEDQNETEEDELDILANNTQAEYLASND